MAAGLFSLGAALIGAHATTKASSTSAAAQASINSETMAFNRTEAAKARTFEAEQAAIDRTFNANQNASARKLQEKLFKQANQFSHNEAVLAREFDSMEALKQRDFESAEALKAREFNEMMSNTAHQREVADLRAAGLNPILSANSGASYSGAMVPSGASASASSPSSVGVPGIGAASHNGGSSHAASVSGLQAPVYRRFLGEFISNAMQGMRLENDVKRADADVLKAEAAAKEAETSRKLGESSIALNEEKALNLAAERMREDKLSEQTINESKARISNAFAELKSKVELMQKQGNMFNAQGALSAASISKINVEMAKLGEEITGKKISNEQAEIALEKMRISGEYRKTPLGTLNTMLGTMLDDLTPSFVRLKGGD